MGHPVEVGATEWLANLSIGYVVVAAFVLTAIRLVLVPSRGPLARSIAELVESLIIAGVLVFLIIRPFFLQAFFIPSESMEPTLMGHNEGLSQTGEFYKGTIHDHIFVDKLSYRFRDPRRDEIIVFKAEKSADKAAEFEHRPPVENVLIKRLIGLPGDTIEVKEDPADHKMHVFINGKVHKEGIANPDGACSVKPYCIKEEMADPQSAQAEYAVRGALKLGPGQLFVMGDNRNNSNDSRFWGPLPRNRVIGRAAVIFWPLNRIRAIH